MARCCSIFCCSVKLAAIAIALIAVLISVANPILNEWIAPLEDKNDDSSAPRLPFDPMVTDLIGYDGMGFVKEGQNPELNMGLSYMMYQSFPRWWLKLMERYEPEKDDLKNSSETRSIDILDARKRESEISFEKNGFALIDMKDDPSIQTVKNWRSQTDIKQFQNELEPHLRKLFPNATRIEFTYNVIRGGNKFGDQPAAINGPHLDYTQNDTARVLFHEEYPVFEYVREPKLLKGEENSEDEEMKVMLGIWKPIDTEMGVCDHPLAVMDAATFSPQQESLYPIHINFGFFTLHNLNGGIRHRENQKWYYYPFQKESEVLVFTQYSKDRHFCNPHGSFENTNCPIDADKRVSVEMRAGVFMKK